MKKVCLDANVLLEILFRRARYDKVTRLLEDMSDVQFCVSVLSVDLVMYFIEIEKQSKETAWKFLEKYQKIDITEDDVDWAHDNDQGDFEDALQVSCARRHNCARLITLDQDLESMYGTYLPIQTVH
jgi:predicted nucleic acid-binding protein